MGQPGESRARHVLRGDAGPRIEVFDAERPLAEVLAKPGVKDWVCDHVVSERQVGITAAQRAREWVNSAEPTQVAEFLIGGITKADVQRDVGLVWESADPTSMLLPPLPNFLFQRDPSCWIFDGVTINPMTKPARQPETVIVEAIPVPSHVRSREVLDQVDATLMHAAGILTSSLPSRDRSRLGPLCRGIHQQRPQ
jgi:arginine deiminase